MFNLYYPLMEKRVILKFPKVKFLLSVAFWLIVGEPKNFHNLFLSAETQSATCRLHATSALATIGQTRRLHGAQGKGGVKMTKEGCKTYQKLSKRDEKLTKTDQRGVQI